MKRGRRNLCAVLLCCLMLLASVFALPGTAKAATQQVSTWEDLCRLLCLPESYYDTLQLACDILWDESQSGFMEVADGQTITIDLAGHTIDRGLAGGDPQAR